MECRKTISFISLWAGFLLIISLIMQVKWFELGDMGWREVMFYHGLMICAWALLLLSCIRAMNLGAAFPKWQKTLCFVCFLAAVLAGIGGSLITSEGLSLGRIIQIAGMVLADFAAIAVIVLLIFYARSIEANNKFAVWSAAIILAAISLATPLGHLAGAIKDIGDKLPWLAIHAGMIGAEKDAAVDSYIGSHSHQIVAAFLVCACIVPLMSISKVKNWAAKLMYLAITITLLATISQLGLYQYSAWAGWEPPTLFESGPNGMPLDDLILSIVAIGPLLAVPAVWLFKDNDAQKNAFSSAQNRLVYLGFVSYVAAMVILGIYIEFHEGFFGGAEEKSGAAGVTNDLAYIRGHLLYGCMMLPLLMSFLLNLRKPSRAMIAIASAVILVGAAGVFLWTFKLNPVLTKIGISLCGALLVIGSVECWNQKSAEVVKVESAAQVCEQVK